MYNELALKRNGFFQGAPFFEVYLGNGTLIASGPFDHCTAVMKAYMV